ncbi:hypothetical protein BT96DRAFT_941952 [Gymnopus androsaceus JB14]|uniref:Uncharacterized protein n=1 Tax=Gymnopus androsaceus JB14 TaxID=1447944 RepID=A0A6A4HG95_9AGAR|nr:hypothetical protein BT96DRAFT_941952 [Gymnopus androsaceus JB14]
MINQCGPEARDPLQKDVDDPENHSGSLSRRLRISLKVNLISHIDRTVRNDEVASVPVNAGYRSLIPHGESYLASSFYFSQSQNHRHKPRRDIYIPRHRSDYSNGKTITRLSSRIACVAVVIREFDVPDDVGVVVVVVEVPLLVPVAVVIAELLLLLPVPAPTAAATTNTLQ